MDITITKIIFSLLLQVKLSFIYDEYVSIYSFI